jgi:DNA gyrase/topoisomerase IV subunit B
MANYTAKDITVLEGLEPVRKRPGMYIGGVGTAGLHHLVWEILDNAVDEAMNGFASNISVTLHADGSSITIADDGRGIPVDKHEATKKSALEVIFTVLHAGGKFEQGNYKTAGGLHGVGASVVNALSAELRATVKRDGAAWEMSFKRGKPTGPLKKAGPARGTGTSIYFHPDPTIFPKVGFDAATIRERLEIVREERRFRAPGRARRLPTKDHRRARRQARARGAIRPRSRKRTAPRARAAMDRGDRRARAQLCQRHPHDVWRHARERVAGRHR